MKVLVGCEYSGIVREAFRRKGHCAYSCDILPADDESEWHIQNDVIKAITKTLPWDLIILHPPCTALTVAGNSTYGKGMPKNDERMKALEWTHELWRIAKTRANQVALENPVGVLNSIEGMPKAIMALGSKGMATTLMGIIIRPSITGTTTMAMAMEGMSITTTAMGTKGMATTSVGMETITTTSQGRTTIAMATIIMTTTTTPMALIWKRMNIMTGMMTMKTSSMTMPKMVVMVLISMQRRRRMSLD